LREGKFLFLNLGIERWEIGDSRSKRKKKEAKNREHTKGRKSKEFFLLSSWRQRKA